MNPLLQYDEPLRASYLVILASIATADHSNSEGEVAFMQQIAGVSELTEQSVQEVTKAMQNPASVPFSTHLSKMQASDLKYALVADIVNMLYADGDMDQEELNQVARINTALGITQEQFNVVSDYVKKANTSAAAQEGTPGIMGLMDDNGGGKAGGMDLGGLLGMATDFLTKSGMSNQFQQAGIPTKNFESGSTIGTVLTGLAGAFLQSKMGGGNNNGGGNNPMGNILGGLVGSMLGSSNSGVQAGGNAGNNAGGGGLGSILTSVLTSPQGQDAIKGILGQVMGSNQKGSGLSNMASVLGGGRKDAGALGGLMDMFLK